MKRVFETVEELDKFMEDMLRRQYYVKHDDDSIRLLNLDTVEGPGPIKSFHILPNYTGTPHE